LTPHFAAAGGKGGGGGKGHGSGGHGHSGAGAGSQNHHSGGPAAKGHAAHPVHNAPGYHHAFYAHDWHGWQHRQWYPLWGRWLYWSPADGYWYRYDDATETYAACAELTSETLPEGPTATVSAVIPASYGVKITGLHQGTAVQQGMRVGDIILSFNGTPTPSFEALRDAVQQSGSQAKVIFRNAANGQRGSIVLFPVDGSIGVDVVPVPVS